ncbi:hypothetical protein SRABI80_02223 [Peribacillus frigoritolerans]|nr:hypothetical protein SRABI80_02223 [Peribacillus frigoritolerans]
MNGLMKEKWRGWNQVDDFLSLPLFYCMLVYLKNIIIFCESG